MLFSKAELNRMAKELGFIRDTFEKVCRLVDVLSYIQKDVLLSESLALKGGTAINLTVFELPRLSVDIDLDFSECIERELMIKARERITVNISKIMEAAGYKLSMKSKYYHALDSFVYEYINAGGTKDNLKIEINYMLRCHILPILSESIFLPWANSQLSVLRVHPIEIFAAKTMALLNRAAPRDLYDMFNMVKLGIFDEAEQALLRKCIIFYAVISSGDIPELDNFKNMGTISSYKIRTELVPVLRGNEKFDPLSAREEIKTYLSNVLKLDDRESDFIKAFAERDYRPELLFEDDDILLRIKNHPMALWRCGLNKVN